MSLGDTRRPFPTTIFTRLPWSFLENLAFQCNTRRGNPRYPTPLGSKRFGVEPSVRASASLSAYINYALNANRARYIRCVYV